MHRRARLMVPAALVLSVFMAGAAWRLVMAARGAGTEGVRMLAESRPAAGFKVLTYNIRHGATEAGGVDLAEVAAIIRQSGADLVALQEVDQLQGRSGLADQARWLAGELGMEYAFGPARRRGFGRYGNALLSRYPILASENVPLPGSLEPRGALLASVRVPGGPATVVVTHLGLSAADRESQAWTVLDRVLPATGPVLLMGDWNSQPGAPEVAGLEGRFRNALGVVGLGEAKTFRAGFEMPYAASDRVFVSGEFLVLGGRVMEEARSSDHHPVMVELSLDGVQG